jgi:hypothetical protein
MIKAKIQIMIIVELSGGAGNQFFQYAAAIALALKHNAEVKVVNKYLFIPNKTLGNTYAYGLSSLAEPAVVASDDEIIVFRDTKANVILNLFGLVRNVVFKEKQFHYNNRFWNAGSNVYLKGTFQSEKYFIPYQASIHEKLRLPDLEYQKIVPELWAIISSSGETISMHVRRGDYVTNRIANDVLGVLPISYYKEGYEYILQTTDVKNTLIFSNDIDWAKQNFNFVENAIFVDTRNTRNDLIDFYLMQHCTHNIIANSSFSWWAAYLNKNPNKIVIAPKKWFNKAPYDTKDLIPETWIRI